MKYGSDECFTEQIKVRYSEIYERGKLRPTQLVGYLQDLAVLHSNRIGYDTNYLAEHHLAWLLLYWDIDIDRLPEDEEVLTMMTWAVPYRRVQSNRDSEITDASDRRICYASARWVLTDIVRRRPYKMTPEFFEPYTFPNSRPVREVPYDFPELTEEQKHSERNIIITRRDVDNNSHVNNKTYVDWAFDDIDDDTWKNYEVKNIKVAYKHEFRMGDPVISKYYIQEEDANTRILSSLFISPGDPAKPHCRVTSTWKK